MFFDKILSRFKIQTKVFLFVLPFVVSMSAVGLLGLYASDILVGRMEISNSVMTSLRGFKDVYASMNRFLANVSDATYTDAKQRASEQLTALQKTAVTLAVEEGVQQLRQAIGEAEGISDNIESVWQLHSAEMMSLADIYSTLDEMVKMQEEMQRHINAFGDTGRRKVNRNKADLQKWYSLEITSDTLNKIALEYLNEPDLTTKLEIIKSHTDEMANTIKAATFLLPKDNELLLALKIASQSLVDALSSNDASHLGLADTEFTELKNIAASLKALSAASLSDTIKQFKENDLEVAKADAIAERMREIGLKHASIRVLASELVHKPSSATLETVQQSLYMYRIAVDRVAGDAKSDPYFASLGPLTTSTTDRLMKIGTTLLENDAQQKENFAEAARRIDRTWGLLSDFAAQQKDNAGRERSTANRISIAATILGIVIATFAGIGMVFTFKGPIGHITATMRRLADGMLDTGISGERRSDEIGDMARALTVFKDNALAKVSMEEEAEKGRRVSEAERRRNEQERFESNLQIEFAIKALAIGLSELAHGHLNAEIDTPFVGNLDKLRLDFNTSVAGLRDTLVEILESSSLIQESGRSMHEAADDLSKRTEQQAAALEQTAASVGEITATVRTSTDRTMRVLEIVRKAKQKADNSGEIVQDAMSAMTRIRKASESISEIVSVIDSIAFQTNLLALNAGVEAARAGETGKGFAVVAHEVRQLAQRSANAAKEIGGLIANATDEVAIGARFVEETGTALIEISTQIVDISGHVDYIATSARDQSVSLEEVNASVNAMDQMTQRNAAMVEETNAATRGLAGRADLLMGLINRFEFVKKEKQSTDDEAA